MYGLSPESSQIPGKEFTASLRTRDESFSSCTLLAIRGPEALSYAHLHPSERSGACAQGPALGAAQKKAALHSGEVVSRVGHYTPQLLFFVACQVSVGHQPVHPTSAPKNVRYLEGPGAREVQATFESLELIAHRRLLLAHWSAPRVGATVAKGTVGHMLPRAPELFFRRGS